MLWDQLGLRDLRLEINSLGSAKERLSYREALLGWFSDRRQQLDADSLRRLERNPLRILDSKNPDMRPLIESSAHFSRLQEYLVELGVDFTINPRLVRGLDYYSHTVFEWITDRLGAQGTVCAGGRYFLCRWCIKFPLINLKLVMFYFKISFLKSGLTVFR